MDTRLKILDPPAAAEAAGQARRLGQRIQLVSGYFDPLLAAHARRLREIAGQGAALFVRVLDPARPILPARARAELIAALEVVDYVVLGDAVVPADEVYSEEAADERRTRDLTLYVQSR